MPPDAEKDLQSNQSSDKSERISQALAKVLKALEGLSNSDATTVVNMVASTLGRHTVSNFQAPISVVPSRGGGPVRLQELKRPKARNAPQDPAMREWRKAVEDVNHRISVAAAALNPPGKLPSGHALLVERDQLFRDRPKAPVTKDVAVRDTTPDPRLPGDPSSRDGGSNPPAPRV